MNQDVANQLKYGTDLHGKVMQSLRDRLRMSENKMRNRYAKMAQNEELFQAYIPEKEDDAQRRTDRDTSGIPTYRTLEIPYSYAVLMTAHTYYTSVFLARNPVFQLSGRHGESEQQTQAMEALLAYQMTVGQNLVPLFIWLLDPGKYGFGVVGHYWDKESVRMRQEIEVPETFLGMPIPGKTKKQMQVQDVVGFEGNRIYNIRPQDFFPDPRVPLVHFQRGEFCSRYAEVPWNEIYEGQKSFRYFNYEQLKRLRAERGGQAVQAGDAVSRDVGSSRVTELPGTSEADGAYDVPVGFIKGHEVYLKIIPREWKLGEGDRQEIWCFNVSTNGVIFGAMPLGEYSGKFPFDVLLDEIDGYTLFPKATIERVKPLNDIITWLVNTHFYNVRSAMNNQFLVDPSMVVMKDVENPGPGKIIRLKPQAYGKDVRTALHQLQVADVTRQHIGEVGLLTEFIQKVTGVNDSIMGAVNQGGRKTATEVRTSTSFGINRLKTQCEWFSNTGFSPLTTKLVQRTQQNYDKMKKFRLVGDLGMMAPQFANVDPAAISGFFDFEPVDGTLPVDRFAQANLWQMIMGQMAQQPAILAQYDIAKIFGWVANLAGIKNIAQFKIMPDQLMQQQMQAGNVIPLKSATPPNLAEPRQIPGAGPTG